MKYIFFLTLIFNIGCFNKGKEMDAENISFKVDFVHDYQNDNGDGTIGDKSKTNKTFDGSKAIITLNRSWDLLTLKPKEESKTNEIKLTQINRKSFLNLIEKLLLLKSGEFGNVDYVNDEGIDQYSLQVEFKGESRSYTIIHTHLADPTLPLALVEIIKLTLQFKI